MAPYTHVRVSRLILAVRMACKMPILLQRLLFVTKTHDKPLLKTLDGDIQWLKDVEPRIPVLRLDWNKFQNTKDVVKIIKMYLKGIKGLVI